MIDEMNEIDSGRWNEAPGDLLVEYVKIQWLTLGEWGSVSIIAQSWLLDSQIAVKKWMGWTLV